MAHAPEHLPTPDEERELHRRLVERDPTAPADLALAFLNALMSWLQSKNSKKISEHLLVEAAEDALIALSKNPGSYRTDLKKSLFSYLQMSAMGDLKNGLNREKRQIRRNIGQSLELSSGDGKYVGRTDDQLLRLEIHEELQRADDGILAAARDGLSPGESEALDLILQGERTTAVFARALGFEHLSKAEQKAGVKKVKDKLKSRIKRGRK
jgi:hypothetical protein